MEVSYSSRSLNCTSDAGRTFSGGQTFARANEPLVAAIVAYRFLQADLAP